MLLKASENNSATQAVNAAAKSESSSDESIIALVDCNSFFCSCERVFNPKLKNKPVVVLSSNDGCIVARTDEAKALGIKMGEAYFTIKDLIKKHSVFVYSSNFALYGDLSRRVMTTLQDFTPDLDVYSIDEAFLSLKGMHNRDLRTYALQIRDQVYKNTGVPISVGIAPTKVLAKVANYFSKKNKISTQGVYDLRKRSDQDLILKSFAVENLWGVGRKSAEKLKRYGIHTAKQLREADEKFIQKLLSIQGRRILLELRGESCIDIKNLDQDKKQIISSRSFGKPVYLLEELQESVANHICSAAEKLRKQKSVVKHVSVFIQTSPFKQTPQYYNSAAISLLSGTCLSNKLIAQAFQLLSAIYKRGYEYKKTGVIFSDLSPMNNSQCDLFSGHDQEHETRLMQVFDAVNKREGPHTLRYAACGTNQFWKARSDHKSAAFTTRWSELLTIKI